MTTLDNRRNRSIIAEEESAGRQVVLDDVFAACGDPRDWFLEPHRLKGHRVVEARHSMARSRRRPNAKRSGHSFSHSLIIGEMGASKSVLATYLALKKYLTGDSVFSNGSFLFGRRIEDASIYSVMTRIPHYSFVFVDEGHSVLESNAGNLVGLREFVILDTNLRKIQCDLAIASAQGEGVHYKVRSEADRVLNPIKIEINQGSKWKIDRPGHSDPRNFVLAWNEWRNFPLKKAGLLDPYRKSIKHGLGKPDRTRVARGELVRLAFMLCDSFEPMAEAFAIGHANKDAIMAARAQEQEQNLLPWQSSEQFEAVGIILDGIIESLQNEGKERFRPSHIAARVGQTPQTLGRILHGRYGHLPDAWTGKDWRIAPIVEMINA